MVKIRKTIVTDFPGNLNLAKPYPAKEQETSAARVDNIVISAERSVDWEYFKETTDAVAVLKEQGYTIISIEQAVDSIKLNNVKDELLEGGNGKYALIFGNEVKGVQQEVVDMSDNVIEIPQFGTKHSLNISVSLGVVLWEFCKFFKL